MYWAHTEHTEVAQSCPTLCDPMDCSPPGSLVHGIFQAWILEWVAVFFSRGSSWPRDRTRVSRIVGRRFTVWATREVHEKHRRVVVSISQLQIPARQEKDPRKRYCSHPEDSPACSLRSCRLWNVFLEDCETFFNLAGRYLPRNNTSHSRWLKSLLVQGSEDLSPVYLGVQSLPNCVSSLELSWEVLSPET